MNSIDEQEIVARFQVGDVKAFRKLFDEFYPRLCYFTARLIDDSEEGRKITTDVFEKLFRRHIHFNTWVNIQAFLYISCRNSCLNYLKARERNRKKEKEFISLQSDRFVEMEFLEATVIKAIHTAVESLSPQCRRVVEMLYFEEKTYTEIALSLGVTESTVRNQKRRALQLLKEKLGPSQFLLLVLLFYGGLLQYILFQPVAGLFFKK